MGHKVSGREGRRRPIGIVMVFYASDVAYLTPELERFVGGT
jgi:hypothetical protein